MNASDERKMTSGSDCLDLASIGAARQTRLPHFDTMKAVLLHLTRTLLHRQQWRPHLCPMAMLCR